MLCPWACCISTATRTFKSMVIYKHIYRKRDIHINIDMDTDIDIDVDTDIDLDICDRYRYMLAISVCLFLSTCTCGFWNRPAPAGENDTLDLSLGSLGS